MKCIKSIKETKNTTIGEIKRVGNQEADLKVNSGYWKFIPKSEWKEITQVKKTEDSESSAQKNQKRLNLKKK